MITFGEHARELLPVESFFALLNDFIAGYTAPCYTEAGAKARFILNSMNDTPAYQHMPNPGRF